MSNQILKDAGLSGVSDSSSSRGSKGGRADEPNPIATVMTTGVIDLNPEFGEPTTRIVDDATEKDSVGEASTSRAVAPVICGGFLPVGLNPETMLIDLDLLPKPDERADSADNDWTYFYELLFRQGLRFPIPYLIRRLLALFDMASGQLMPNGWRLLLSIEVLHERMGWTFTLANFIHSYYKKSHEDEP
ncbi:hypothetical protein ACOSQ3_027237 [Xanthoceras sorbifolium]